MVTINFMAMVSAFGAKKMDKNNPAEKSAG
jgi:hypothetical protein